MFNKDKLSCLEEMVKRTADEKPQPPTVPTRELIRRSSNRLERHIFHRNRSQIQEFLEKNSSSISFTTYERYSDLLREVKREAEDRKEREQTGNASEDSEERLREIKKKERLMNEFDELLDRSLQSYQRTYNIFKNTPLRQRYQHLLGVEEVEECKSPEDDLEEGEESALKKIKTLYRKYRVSNMYKVSVCSKISKTYVEKLIKRGLLREKNEILSLVC